MPAGKMLHWGPYDGLQRNHLYIPQNETLHSLVHQSLSTFLKPKQTIIKKRAFYARDTWKGKFITISVTAVILQQLTMGMPDIRVVRLIKYPQFAALARSQCNTVDKVRNRTQYVDIYILWNMQTVFILFCFGDGAFSTYSFTRIPRVTPLTQGWFHDCPSASEPSTWEGYGEIGC